MIYFLIGMPGCGKSTLGKELSKVLSLPYVDLDEWIESKEGMTIPQVFEKFGQDYFRQKETEALKWVISNYEEALVSTGGGAPCFNDNMSLMNAHGSSIFINVSLDELFKRLRLGKQNRPLVQGLSDSELYEKIQKMLSDRLPFYNLGTVNVEGDNLSVNDVLKALEMEA
jgi:shikimate kinase